MNTFKWNGPGALSHAGKLIKQGGEIPQEIVEVLSKKTEGEKLSQFEKFQKSKPPKVSEIVVEEDSEEEVSLADMSDEDILALSEEELSSDRFPKKDLVSKAKSYDIKVASADNKDDLAGLILAYLSESNG